MTDKGETKMIDISDLPKPKVTLVGKDGNAFAILASCRQALRKAGWTSEQQEAFFDEATSGDYNNVLCTAIKYLDVY